MQCNSGAHCIIQNDHTVDQQLSQLNIVTFMEQGLLQGCWIGLVWF